MVEQIKHVKITEVFPNEANPRFITDDNFDRLVQSIKNFPEMMEKRPIVVDENMIALGGNKRLKACEAAGLKKVYILIASGWTKEQKDEFIIKDNVNFGSWDWDVLANEWDTEEIEKWGMDIPVFQDMDDMDTSEEFSLRDGDKEPFQQITFTLADEQANHIKKAIEDVMKTDRYKHCKTMGNENTNGNALYLIVSEWAEQRK